MLGVRPRLHHAAQRRKFLTLGLLFNGEDKTHKITKKINVPSSLLYRVVADVTKYEDFVPFVTKSFVNEYDEETGLPTMAGLRVGWNEYDEKFVCKLRCIKNELLIVESATILLFEYLHNEWKFKEVRSNYTSEKSTIVDFCLKYKFKNPLYNTVSFLFHDKVTKVMMKAFEDRALELKRRKLEGRLGS